MRLERKKIRRFLRRKITFLLIPHHAGRPFRLSFSVSALSVLVFAILGAGFATLFVFLRQADYRSVRREHRQAVLDNAFFTDELYRLREMAQELEVIQEGIQSFSDFIPRENSSGRRGEGGFNFERPARRRPEMGASLDRRAFKRELAALENDLVRLRKEFEVIRRTPLLWPVEGRVTSPFGYRTNPFSGRREFHSGIDIANARGTLIISPADGIVTGVEYNRFAGRLLTIDHGEGLVTRYAHCDRILVAPGDEVARGQEVARVGNTGLSTGPHLHYEVHLNGRALNPWRFMVFRAVEPEDAGDDA